MGIGVALDDFGTGYSSLSYIARLPANTLKLDRSFVADMAAGRKSWPSSRRSSRSAHALDMKIVAEGVETHEQSELLKRLKCDELQGFLFSRPLPLEQLEAMLGDDAPPWMNGVEEAGKGRSPFIDHAAAKTPD